MSDQPADALKTDLIQTVTLGGGCFWCLEPVFEELHGVINVEVGYAGGKIPKPSYEQVSSGMTGHAEVVQIQFDPGIISFAEILWVFFNIHDPTMLNRQGADIGTQYRSIILYHNLQQKKIAEDAIQQIDTHKMFPNPVVTEIAPYEEFYRAEDYHQGYFKKNPYQGYCSVVIAPKISKFRKKFQSKLKKQERT